MLINSGAWNCTISYMVVRMAAVWTKDKITELIDLYEDYPCLYNTKDKNYHDRDCRNKAVAEIAAKLEITGMFSAITI